jgi:hypothetical protein
MEAVLEDNDRPAPQTLDPLTTVAEQIIMLPGTPRDYLPLATH